MELQLFTGYVQPPQKEEAKAKEENQENIATKQADQEAKHKTLSEEDQEDHLAEIEAS